MSILTILKNAFKNNDERNKELIDRVNKDTKKFKPIKPDGIRIGYDVLYTSPNIALINTASRLCVGMNPNKTYEEQKAQVGRMSNRNHWSVFEHSNVIAVLYFNKGAVDGSILLDIAEILSNAKYCNVKVSETKSRYNILIGGSSRAFGHILLETNPNNSLINTIKVIMETSFEKEILIPYIRLGLLNENLCTYVPSNPDKMDIKTMVGDRVNLLWADPVDYIYTKAKKFGFSMKDIYDVSIISFLFHDISRACYDQMARHRNAISTESQRYVQHKTGYVSFIDPFDIVDYPDIDEDTRHRIHSMDPFYIYSFALKSGLKKEDARAWLPMNAKIRSAMTFTYSYLSHFIQLRSDKSAQSEVQLVSKEINKYVDNIVNKTIVDTKKEKEFSGKISTLHKYNNYDNYFVINNVDETTEEADNDVIVDDETSIPEPMDVEKIANQIK